MTGLPMQNGGQSIGAPPSPLARLVAACRGLNLALRGKRNEPNAVLIMGDRRTFPIRLWDVAAALEGLSAATANSSGGGQAMDARVMAAALIERVKSAPTGDPACVKDMQAIADYLLDGRPIGAERADLMRIVIAQQERLVGKEPPPRVMAPSDAPAVSVSRDRPDMAHPSRQTVRACVGNGLSR